MKIASATFSPKIENIGGAQIPAIAFRKWCDILGVQCDSIGIVDEVHAGDVFNEGIDLIVSSRNMYDLLNSYDAVLFVTPPIYVDFDIDNISTKYMFMIHGEGDFKLYGQKTIFEMASGIGFNGVCHIDSSSEQFGTNVFWHPCTYPEFLIKESIDMSDNNGMLYAARIRNWLNPSLFIMVAKRNMSMIGMARMSGPCAKRDKITSLRKNSGFVSVSESISKIGHSPEQCGLFWDVAGGAAQILKYKRLSMSAFEALRNGLIPMVSPNSAPDILKPIVIEIDSKNIQASDAHIFRAIHSKDFVCEYIGNLPEGSYFKFGGVKLQVERLILELIK